MPDDFEDEFAHADLNDVRRSRRLVQVACAFFKTPLASITAASGGWKETLATLRLLNSEGYEPDALIAPHRQATMARCREHPCVAVLQDTSEIDFTHMKAATGLGPLNDENRRGFYLHGHYVISEYGLPLGLIDADIMLRDDDHFRIKDTRKQRPIEQKESYRWIEGYQKSVALSRELPDCEVFSISDREGDIFEMYEAWDQAGKQDGPRAEWIIRANQDRALLGMENEESNKLFDAIKNGKVLGEIEFEIRARKGTRKVKGNRQKSSRDARKVCQRIRAMKITPRPPHRPGSKLPEVSFWAIFAHEENPPEGQEPISWLLLTSKEIKTLKQARRILNLYLRRWDIEVFHRVLKTGCRVESVQLKKGSALINALMIYLVIAWRILYLTHLGRQCPELPYGCVFEEAEWKSGCAVVKRGKEKGEPSLGEFMGIVGKLGGHLGRKSDGAPGAQTIWQGLSRVRDFALAWQVFHDD